MNKTELAKAVIVAIACGDPKFFPLLEAWPEGKENAKAWQDWGAECAKSPAALAGKLYIGDNGGGFPLKKLDADQAAFDIVKGSLTLKDNAIVVPEENITWLQGVLQWDDAVLAKGQMVIPNLKLEVKAPHVAASAKPTPPAATPAAAPNAAPAPSAPTGPAASAVDYDAIRTQISVLEGAIPAMGGPGSAGAAGIEAQIATLRGQLPSETTVSETERWARENNVALTTTLADVIAATEGPIAHLRELCETMLSPVAA